MKPRRDERYAIRFSRAERLALEKVAAEKDQPASQILRQALRVALGIKGDEKR